MDMIRSKTAKAFDITLNYLTSWFNMNTRIKVVKCINKLRYGQKLKDRQYYYEQQKEKNPEIWTKPRIQLRDAYALDLEQKLPFLQKVIADSQQLMAINEGAQISSGATPFISNLLTDDRFFEYPSFLNFATSKELIATVADYLGFIPVLSELCLWQSSVEPESVTHSQSSQLYHLDNADTSQVKIFLHLNSVDKSGGPFTFLGAKDSKLIKNLTSYGSVRNVHRLTDKEVYSIVPEENAIECTFPEGSMVYVDTIRCFHFGSRCTIKKRYVLMLQFLSPCRADFRKKGFAHYVKEKDSFIRKLVLDADR